MRNTLIVSGIALAMLAAITASAQAQTNELDFYAKRLSTAKEHCGDDTVLWLNTKTGSVAKPGSSDYGTTDNGRYVCEHDMSNGRYGTRAEPTTTTVTPNGMAPQPAPATPPK